MQMLRKMMEREKYISFAKVLPFKIIFQDLSVSEPIKFENSICIYFVSVG